MDTCDVIVIGAGPAGLTAAAAAAARGLNVVLLEKKRSPGLKLLVSGAGRCNLTHRGETEDFFSRYGGRDKARFVKPSLLAFPPERLEEFFSLRGVPLEELNEGKVFPVSGRSRDVLEALLGECHNQGVRILYQAPVERLENTSDRFLAVTPGGTWSASCVIIAAGGRSWPRTGSTGDGCRLAEELGHKIVPLRPALTPVKVLDFPMADLAGISLPAVLDLYRNDRKLRTLAGDLLFTHQGLSGPVILDSSRYMSPGDSLRLNFPGKEPDRIREDLIREAAARGKSLVKSLLHGYGLPERLVLALLSLAGISRELKLSELDRDGRGRLVKALTALPLEIALLEGWNTSMVTAGGIALDEVSPSSLESRLVPRLHFAGEVLDVDGDTGGYNLQFAFSSGHLAGTSVLKT